MRLLVAVDGHILMTPDRKYWCKTIYSYAFFERYLNVFDDVTVVARVKEVSELEGRFNRIDGDHVDVRGMPFYQGPKQLFFKYMSIQRALRNIDENCDAALFRLPDQSCQMAYNHMRKNIPFAGEIVYDPTDDLNRKDTGFVLRLLNMIISNNLKKFCSAANGVSYVTEHTIQDHFPSYARLYGEDREHFESFYSTITLSEKSFTGPRKYIKKESVTVALCDAAMNSNRKGESVFLEVVARLKKQGIDIHGLLIGDGSMLGFFKSEADRLGIRDDILFTGLLPSSDQVQDIMKKADIYLFPTQAEGLPRSVLEAMALGMPVLSTPIGGIPEIIDSKYLFKPDDVEGFTGEIIRLVNKPNELTEMSEMNYNKSLEFTNEKLQIRRDEFYAKLRRLCKER